MIGNENQHEHEVNEYNYVVLRNFQIFQIFNSNLKLIKLYSSDNESSI